MPMLALADLEGRTEDEVKQHIADEYAGAVSGFDYGSPSDEEKADLLRLLAGFDILIAYEHVGSWGCDSSSWFLLRNKETGVLFENHAGHCSCYGFEGQWCPEETTVAYLTSEKFNLSTGGYDDAGDEHQRAVKTYVLMLTK